MLSKDLAELYEVEHRVLNQQVKRNIRRFPVRYMFKLKPAEYRKILRSQNVILGHGTYAKYPPYAFTEYGVLMLSSVLRSERAEKVNMVIIDTFVKLRALLLTHKDLLTRIESIERDLITHDQRIVVLFGHLKRLLVERDLRKQQESRVQIGFKK